MRVDSLLNGNCCRSDKSYALERLFNWWKEDLNYDLECYNLKHFKNWLRRRGDELSGEIEIEDLIELVGVDPWVTLSRSICLVWGPLGSYRALRKLDRTIIADGIRRVKDANRRRKSDHVNIWGVKDTWRHIKVIKLKPSLARYGSRDISQLNPIDVRNEDGFVMKTLILWRDGWEESSEETEWLQGKNAGKNLSAQRKHVLSYNHLSSLQWCCMSGTTPQQTRDASREVKAIQYLVNGEPRIEACIGRCKQVTSLR